MAAFRRSGNRHCRTACPDKKHPTIHFVAIAAAFLTTACAGGGSGGITPLTTIGSNAPNSGSGTGSSGGTGGSSGTSGTSSSSTGGGAVTAPVTGLPIDPAEPGTFGATPVAPQLATIGGATFDGSGPYPSSNTTFPALTSSFQYTASSVSPVVTNQSASVTVVSASASGSTLQIVVPSVNLNQTLTFPGTPDYPGVGNGAGIPSYGWDQETLVSNGPGDFVNTFSLSYVSLGLWLHSNGANGTPQASFTAYVFGYETPAAAMPTSGVASYSGVGSVRGQELFQNHVSNGSTLVDANQLVLGDASFSVDFGSNKITGAFTNMKSYGDSGPLPESDVSLSASIAAGTNTFSGATSQPQPSPGNPTAAATGHIDGAFYGPTAQNLGAIWTLSWPGSGASVLGVVGASATSH